MTGVVKEARTADTGRPRSDGENRSYFPVIDYEYVVDGKTFTSDRIHFGLAGIRSEARPEIVEFVAQYQPGSEVTVYFNPEDPSVSCLEPGIKLAW